MLASNHCDIQMRSSWPVLPHGAMNNSTSAERSQVLVFEPGEFLWPASQVLWAKEKLRPRKALGACKASYQPLVDQQNSSSLAGKLRTKIFEGGRLTEAVEAVDLMLQQGSCVDDSVLYHVLKRCITQKDLVLGSQVHALAVKSGYESDPFLANHIICMYAAHGRLEEATQVFTKVSSPNCYMWASIILAHARHEQPKEAIKLYRRLRASPLKPNNHIFMAALKACAIAMDLSAGNEVHADIVRISYKPNLVVGTCLVDMYSKCGSLEDARRVFDNLVNRDVVTWNAMLSGYAQHGHGQGALDLYASMQEEGIIRPNRVTFVCLLQACAGMGALQQGRQLHAQIKELRLECDVAVGNCLVNMYAKCGSLEDARQVFDNLSTKDVVSWNAMIRGYAQDGHGHEALNLYRSMQHEGITPADAITFLSLLQACANIGALHQGMQLHSQIKEKGLEADVAVGNCLVSMYAKCRSLESARIVFDNLHTKDVVTWTAIIAGYAQQGRGHEALSLYGTMQVEGISIANRVTFVCLLQACASIGDLHQGRLLDAQIRERGLEGHIVIGNCLVDMYAKCGSLEDARRVFDSLAAKDVVTWNVMITGYAQNGMGQEALDLYESMQEGMTPPDSITFISLLQACASIQALVQGKKLHSQIQKQATEADLVVGNALLNMYAKCKSLDEAREVFNNLKVRDVATWNAMIGGYAQHGQGVEALALYGHMQQEGITAANAVTYVCILQACGSVAGLEKGKEVHARISASALHATDLCVANALIDMYSKCGSMGDAHQVFATLPVKDIVTWNTLIAGFARQGEDGLVFGLFQNMNEEGMQPNSITFLSLLTACSHLGLVDMGQKYIEVMSRVYGISPTIEHYTCMVDLLGRAGQLDKAMEMVKTMPLQPNAVVWRCVLTACQKWRDVELGRLAFEAAVALDIRHPAAYVLMSNIYTAACRQEDATRIQALRLQAQAWKEPGESWWTDIKGNSHAFAVADWGHPEVQNIYANLGDIFYKMEEEGWIHHLDSLYNEEVAHTFVACFTKR